MENIKSEVEEPTPGPEMKVGVGLDPDKPEGDLDTVFIENDMSAVVDTDFANVNTDDIAVEKDLGTFAEIGEDFVNTVNAVDVDIEKNVVSVVNKFGIEKNVVSVVNELEIKKNVVNVVNKLGIEKNVVSVVNRLGIEKNVVSVINKLGIEKNVSVVNKFGIERKVVSVVNKLGIEKNVQRKVKEVDCENDLKCEKVSGVSITKKRKQEPYDDIRKKKPALEAKVTICDITKVIGDGTTKVQLSEQFYEKVGKLDDRPGSSKKSHPVANVKSRPPLLVKKEIVSPSKKHGTNFIKKIRYLGPPKLVRQQPVSLNETGTVCLDSPENSGKEVFTTNPNTTSSDLPKLTKCLQTSGEIVQNDVKLNVEEALYDLQKPKSRYGRVFKPTKLPQDFVSDSTVFFEPEVPIKIQNRVSTSTNIRSYVNPSDDVRVTATSKESSKNPSEAKKKQRLPAELNHDHDIARSEPTEDRVNRKGESNTVHLSSDKMKMKIIIRELPKQQTKEVTAINSNNFLLEDGVQFKERLNKSHDKVDKEPPTTHQKIKKQSSPVKPHVELAELDLESTEIQNGVQFKERLNQSHDKSDKEPPIMHQKTKKQSSPVKPHVELDLESTELPNGDLDLTTQDGAPTKAKGKVMPPVVCFDSNLVKNNIYMISQEGGPIKLMLYDGEMFQPIFHEYMAGKKARLEEEDEPK